MAKIPDKVDAAEPLALVEPVGYMNGNGRKTGLKQPLLYSLIAAPLFLLLIKFVLRKQ
jgi:hypothetical protein